MADIEVAATGFGIQQVVRWVASSRAVSRCGPWCTCVGTGCTIAFAVTAHWTFFVALQKIARVSKSPLIPVNSILTLILLRLHVEHPDLVFLCILRIIRMAACC